MYSNSSILTLSGPSIKKILVLLGNIRIGLRMQALFWVSNDQTASKLSVLMPKCSRPNRISDVPDVSLLSLCSLTLILTPPRSRRMVSILGQSTSSVILAPKFWTYQSEAAVASFDFRWMWSVVNFKASSHHIEIGALYSSSKLNQSIH